MMLELGYSQQDIKIFLQNLPDMDGPGNKSDPYVKVGNRIRDGHAVADDADSYGLMRICAYADAMQKTKSVCA